MSTGGWEQYEWSPCQGIRRYSKIVASLRYRYMTNVVKYFEGVATNQTVLL